MRRYFSSVFTLMEFELRKIRHDSSQVWIRSVQPALWLLVFGEVFTKIKAIPTGNYTYLQFMTPGVLAQSVMFVAIFYGITIVWERDLGILNKLLASPAPRSAIVIGKILSAGLRGVFQAIMVVILALILQVKISFNPLHLLGVLIIVILLGMTFASLSLTIASFFKTRERVMGIGQALTMPLFFASSAIYPISVMPTWIKTIATINPLSYIVDALRRMLLTGYTSTTPLTTDILAIVLSTAVLVTAASLSFLRIVS
jgi:ABC-2 type transport system permease protein